MALPWRRRRRTNEPPQSTVTDRRFQTRDRRLQRSRREEENRRQRLFIIVGVLIVLAILAIPGYGYYKSFVAPPRELVARIRDTRLTTGDLLQRLRLQQGLNRSSGQAVDLSTLPFEYLQRMTTDELIRQEAPNLGVTVTKANVEAELRAGFYPTPRGGEKTSLDQLKREYNESYSSFLTAGQLSDGDYRSLVEADLYRDKLREELGKQIPGVEEQVEVHWIRLPSNPESVSIPSEVIKRLEEGEDFAVVADQVSLDTRYADENGYVGWVPRTAFPGLDPYFFGDEENEPLAHDQLSDVISVRDGIYILKVVGGPEVREISDLMRERMKDSALETWVQEQQQIGAADGWFQLKFNSGHYAWVAKQVRASAPRTSSDAEPR